MPNFEKWKYVAGANFEIISLHLTCKENLFNILCEGSDTDS